MVLVKRLAVADLPVLVCGETGAGKDVVAHAIHHWSPREKAPLVNLNCAAVPDNLLEGELFGYEKGAFSGALAAKPGLLETGAGGTVFLDEVGELSASSQAKLLRVLETKRVTRLGGVSERSIDIRIVAATNRDLATEVKNGGFRQDLFYRLSGATVWIPPLRDRQRELPILAQLFLDEACTRLGRPPMELADDAMRVLAAYEWPGNVRELKNVIDFVAAAHADSVIEPRHLLPKLGPQTGAGADQTSPGMLALGGWPLGQEVRAPTTSELGVSEETPPPQSFRPLDEELRDLEKRRMAQALEAANGNQTQAAKLIGMPLRTFQAKVKQHGLRKKPRSSKRS
jgi:transcriptional regulator with GAF, ATPase, and Fis domain